MSCPSKLKYKMRMRRSEVVLRNRKRSAISQFLTGVLCLSSVLRRSHKKLVLRQLTAKNENRVGMWFVVTKREIGIINVESEGRNFESRRSGFSNGMLMLTNIRRFLQRENAFRMVFSKRAASKGSFILRQHVKGFFIFCRSAIEISTESDGIVL
jgi:hypothetical protein